MKPAPGWERGASAFVGGYAFGWVLWLSPKTATGLLALGWVALTVRRHAAHDERE